MTAALVIGVDPGPTTGIVALPFDGGAAGTPMVLQCDHASTMFFVEALLEQHPDHTPLLAVEAFVVGPRSSRSRQATAGQITRSLIGELSALKIDVVSRPAGLVKPWATDRRLYAAGIIVPTSGMNHARDAARHALYAAVHQGLTADPMSARAGAR